MHRRTIHLANCCSFSLPFAYSRCSVRPQKSDHCGGATLKVLPMGIAPGNMPQQHQMQRVTICQGCLAVNWQVGDERQTRVIRANEAGERVLTHDVQRQGQVVNLKLSGKVHGWSKCASRTLLLPMVTAPYQNPVGRICPHQHHSHSMVAGGLLETS